MVYLGKNVLATKEPHFCSYWTLRKNKRERKSGKSKMRGVSGKAAVDFCNSRARSTICAVVYSLSTVARNYPPEQQFCSQTGWFIIKWISYILKKTYKPDVCRKHSNKMESEYSYLWKQIDRGSLKLREGQECSRAFQKKFDVQIYRLHKTDLKSECRKPVRTGKWRRRPDR